MAAVLITVLILRGPNGDRVLVAPRANHHTIATRVVRGRAQLYDARTGRAFVPRGANYVRLARLRDVGGSQIDYHATFNVGRYDARRAEHALASMQALGYNTVRVFLDAVCVDGCLASTDGLSRAYVANLVDFLRRADAHHMLVMLTLDFLPTFGRYAALLRQGESRDVSGPNAAFLTSAGRAAEASFWQGLVSALVRAKAPLRAILAYELRNELAYSATDPPLTLRTGTFRTPDGKRWNLAISLQRRRMLAAATVAWLDETRAAIRRVDPTALVGVGFADAKQGDALQRRLVRAVVARSSADVVDVHLYPTKGRSLGARARALGLSLLPTKVLLLGEFGAFRERYPSAAAAATALRGWQAAACSYGFSGWLLWTWNTKEQPELWAATDRDLVIGRALAPLRLRTCAARRMKRR